MGTVKRIIKAVSNQLGVGIVSRRTFEALSSRAQARKADRSIVLDSVNAARLLYYHNLIKLTRNIPGDVVECGIGRKAISFTLLAILLKLEGINKPIYGFDSFAGFPEPTQEDESPRNPQKGQNLADLSSVKRSVSTHLGDEIFMRSKVTFVKGFFEDTLDKGSDRKNCSAKPRCRPL